MQRSKRAETIHQLKQSGFKLVTGFSSLYVNPQGKVYNLKTGKYLKPTPRNFIKPENEYLSVPKLVLQAFAKQPYRNGQIQYIDGNKANLSIQNLKYSRIFEPDRKPEPVNRENLLTAIRCYIQVKERFNVNERLQTRFYLQSITRQRHFFIYKKDLQHIEVFETYINGANTTKTATKHGLTVRDCSVIVNQFIKLLITDILQELENGLLTIQPYSPEPPTKTQILRDYNKDLIKRGCKPLPLRKKSLKEQLRDFQKTIDEFKNQNGQ